MKKSRLLLIFIAVLAVLNVIYYLGQWGGPSVLQYVSDALPALTSFIAVVCLYFTFKTFKEMDFARVSWMLIFIGIFLDFLAETTYGILEIGFQVDMNEHFPSLADIFWCTAYIPLFAGLFMMFFGYKRSGFPLGKIKVYAIIAISSFAVFVAMSYFLLIPILSDSESDDITKLFYLYYPIADLLTVIPAIILFYITTLFGRAVISIPMRMLAVGFICFTIADMLYAYLGWLDIYGNGNLIDVLWHVGYLVIGLAGLYQKELVESVNAQ
jgi:hypothetical protein